MPFQAECLISVVLGGPDLKMENSLCNIHCDLCSLLLTLQRQHEIHFNDPFLKSENAVQFCTSKEGGGEPEGSKMKYQYTLDCRNSTSTTDEAVGNLLFHDSFD